MVVVLGGGPGWAVQVEPDPKPARKFMGSGRPTRIWGRLGRISNPWSVFGGTCAPPGCLYPSGMCTSKSMHITFSQFQHQEGREGMATISNNIG